MTSQLTNELDCMRHCCWASSLIKKYFFNLCWWYLSLLWIPLDLDADYSLDFDSQIGDTLTGQNIVATLKNGAFLETSSGLKYLQLDGVNDYIDLGDNSNNCLGNVELCPTGLTLSMWVLPEKLENGRQW